MSKVSTIREAQKHRRERNIQVELECVLIALLSHKYSFVISRPQKKSRLTLEFVKIKTIIRTDEPDFAFDVQKHLKARSMKWANIMYGDGVAKLTATRRSMLMKRNDVVHLLEDLLFEDNITTFCQKENREGIVGSVAINFYNEFLLPHEEISKTGNAIWNYFMQRLESTLQTTIESGNLDKFMPCFVFEN
ncbi:hypothetical protein EIN_134400 [Entamoeba invadens IP1]|uniref:Uncharacterized protein n=1 Tax=Entamoeba invadens IP1 TaxID=370355 RepID=A0A0A1U086_ENTIV|nr:hypothetical protein EIN_134400 [Entamoeba invadens IP1]ELP85896.1 hypothetical protein EIN_134400 [Entamoeba invadens IP1]|eukprot:XP_004185242.1 hypothetical protein EIN_134400 [Entamoeba invadens IP1]